MSSSIFFRFKSSKNPLQISFDGTSLSVFEVKREIMNIARLGDGKDFDLDILTSDTNEVYDDDTTQIPRSTTVIAKRTPAQKHGAGRAARYISGHMPIHAKNQHRVEKGGPSKSNGAASGSVDTSSMTEEEKLAAVMNASNTQLKADLEASASVPTKRSNFKSSAAPNKPLPPGYICYRCRKKGHWIQECPTNNDPTFDGKKPKRTTGIPRSMLEKVEAPDENKELPQGVFMNQDGDYVRVKTDEATWQKIQEQQKAAAEKAQEAAKGDEELRERGLECALDKRPFVNPVKTPCCHATYCYDCIENALIDGDLLCPNCGEQALLDDLQPDDETSKRLAEYQAEQKRKPTAIATADAITPPAAQEANTESAKSRPSSSEKPKSKKRSAEEELASERRPSNPAAPPQNMNDFVNQMNAMAGMSMPPMPFMGMPPMGPGGMMPMNMNFGGNFGGSFGGNFGNMGFGYQQNGMGMISGMNSGYNNGIPTGPAADRGNGAYFRQPVNPRRGGKRRERDVDYKQL